MRAPHLLRWFTAICLLLAFTANAQSAKPGAKALPVWNQNSGKVEAVLLLEPVDSKWWQARGIRLDTALGVGDGDTLGLVCDRKNGVGSAIGNLADNCLLASVGATRGGTRLGLGFGNSHDTIPMWLAAPNKLASRVNQSALTLIGQKNIGREATVSIGGALARARLVPSGTVPGLADRWDIKTLSVGANVGRFGASIIGRVVDSPVEPGRWEGLGLGLSWRTPWRGQLSVGAENVVTRGSNPFAPASGKSDEGTVPYVRYQQDL